MNSALRIVATLAMLAPGLAFADGAFVVGSFFKDTDGTGGQTVAHTLGTTPKAMMMWTNGNTGATATANAGGLVRTGGTTVTVTTAAAHGFAVGNRVDLQVGEANFAAGTKTITAVPSATTFSYTEAGSNTSSGSAHSFTLWRNSFLYAFGVTDGTTSKSAASASVDAAGTSNASRGMANKVLRIIQWGETTLAEADLTSWSSTQFVLDWTTNDANAYVIHYMIMGGSDISAKTVEWAMPTATGDVAVGGIGFRPDVVFHIHVGTGFTSALPANQVHAGVGWGAMDADGDQWSGEILNWDGAGTTQTQRAQRTDKCLVTIDYFGGYPQMMHWVSMDTDGFTVNVDSVNIWATAGRVISLALKGVNIKTGSFNKRTAGTGTQAVTGLGFTPGAIWFSSLQDVTQANPVAHGRFGMGATDGTNHGASTFQDTDALGTSSVDGIDKTNKLLVKVNNNTPTVDAEAGLTSMDIDGFTLNWTTNDAIATEITYMALGALPVTEARMGAMKATRQGSLAAVEWDTEREVDNLGFHLHRERNARRVRITSALIAGSALLAGRGTTLTNGMKYRWTDQAARGGDVYWLEEVDLRGRSVWHGPIVPEVGAVARVMQGRSALLDSVGSAADELRPSAEVRRSLDSPRGSGAGTGQVKISVREEGWYRVSWAHLLAAGLSPQTIPEELRLLNRGQEVPLRVGDGWVEFYGLGVDTLATDTNIYWVSSLPGTRERIAVQPPVGALPEQASLWRTVERRDRGIYFAALHNGDEDNFFGAVVSPSGADVSITADSRAPGNSTGRLSLVIQGVTEGVHRVAVELNGVAAGMVEWNGQAKGSAEISVGNIASGSNTVRLTSSGPGDVAIVDRLQLAYAQEPVLTGGRARFALEAPAQVTFHGVGNDVRVFDVTDADSPQEQAADLTAEAGEYALTVRASGAGRRLFWVVSDSGLRAPAAVVQDAPSRLGELRRADLVIISHASLLEAARPLVAARREEGLAVALLDVADIYDEFSYGVKDARALKDFLRWLYESWETPPRFVLLLGDASFDPRNFKGEGEFDWVPTRLVDTAALETASDDWFVDFNGDGLAEIPIGRIPAQTHAVASVIISKILAYRPGQLRSAKKVVLLADRSDGFKFTKNVDKLSALLSPWTPVQTLQRSSGTDAAFIDAMKSAVASGTWLSVYAGHGSTQSWSGNTLTSASAASLTSSEPPVFVSLSCLNGFFQDVYGDSLGEALLKAPGAGGVAVWASSGLTLPNDQQAMAEAFSRRAVQGGRLGEVALAAKERVAGRDLRQTWVLLGDPSMRLYAELPRAPRFEKQVARSWGCSTAEASFSWALLALVAWGLRRRTV